MTVTFEDGVLDVDVYVNAPDSRQDEAKSRTTLPLPHGPPSTTCSKNMDPQPSGQSLGVLPTPRTVSRGYRRRVPGPVAREPGSERDPAKH